MKLTLDHLVIAVRDLARATESYRNLFGLAPSWRGEHPAYGTANVLFRLTDTYIELLAPGAAPAQLQPDSIDSPWQRALRDHLDRVGEGLYAIALGTDDIDAAVRSARAAGLTVEDPAAGDGVNLETGARREWVNARIDPRGTRGVRTFIIEHRSPPDALPPARIEAEAASCVQGVDHIVVASSGLDETLRLWRDTFGLDLRRTVAWSPERTLHFLRFGTPALSSVEGTILELAGAPTSAVDPAAGDARPNNQQPATRDLLWGVSYRVDDLARTVARLRAAGIDVSDARTGRAAATAVADLKPGFSHDVRTLFIQKNSAP